MEVSVWSRFMELCHEGKIPPIDSLVDWLSSHAPLVHHGSNCWLWLIQSLDVVKDWIAWKPSNGLQIKIGEDPIFCGSSFSFVCCQLIHELRASDILVLGQIYSWDVANQYSLSWKSAALLNLPFMFHDEWKWYISGLKINGVDRTTEEDILIWSWDIYCGTLSASSPCEAITTNRWGELHYWWYFKIWHWKCPLRMLSFCWLAFKNKNLTGKNLQKKGVGRA